MRCLCNRSHRTAPSSIYQQVWLFFLCSLERVALTRLEANNERQRKHIVRRAGRRVVIRLYDTAAQNLLTRACCQNQVASGTTRVPDHNKGMTPPALDALKENILILRLSYRSLTSEKEWGGLSTPHSPTVTTFGFPFQYHEANAIAERVRHGRESSLSSTSRTSSVTCSEQCGLPLITNSTVQFSVMSVTWSTGIRDYC